ncbi:MAG: aminotransferase class IV [Pisciglobus halotolerans]|nr:aminotransferase class IV [Pisciglobus halotolerans]
METATQATYLLNKEELPTSQAKVLEHISPINIYEVIRIQDGKPLFLKDHLDRFRKSAELLKLPLTLSDNAVKQRLVYLIAQNKVKENNVKLILDSQENLLIFFPVTVYPSKEDYQFGVETTLLKLERKDPNIKVQRADYQAQVQAVREQKKVHEVLLVDHHDFVTEGGRSNLFIIKDNEVYTSPSDSVLLGIVRKKVFAICRKENIFIRETNLPVTELSSVQAAFITGTGNNVLPIRSIDDYTLHSAEDPLVQLIMKRFNEEIEKDISTFHKIKQ